MRSSSTGSARLRTVIVVGILGAPGSSGALALEIARRAAATGARVEMAGVAPPDLDGDAVLLELAAADIGHATVVRTHADGLDVGDLDLALHYLPDIRVIVLVAPPAPLMPPATAAAEYTGAPLVVVGPLEPDAVRALDAAGAGPIVIDPPAADQDGTFAGLVAALAGRLDAGEATAEAWRATVAALAVDRVG